MKFELEPYNRGVTDDVMLEDLKKVASILTKEFVTKDEYEKHGRFCAATLQNRFGSWCKANELAGLRKIRNYNTTPEDCVQSIQSIAQKLGKTILTQSEYEQNGGFGDRIVRRHFGSWKKASERAGLSVSPYYPKRATKELLLENIERLWRQLGRQPRVKDFSEAFSSFCAATYKNHFGTLRKALETFVDTVADQEEGESLVESSTEPAGIRTGPATKAHKTSRTVSWRMRFLVMRRDQFKCCICGKSPATHLGTVLVVDHIVAWDAGGETVLENLQTLCEVCNGGKSNLPMNDA